MRGPVGILNFGCFVALFLAASPARAQQTTQKSQPDGTTYTQLNQSHLAGVEADYVVHDFHFKSGETLPELRMHYLTFGAPAHDAGGHVTNAVLILHGTGG